MKFYNLRQESQVVDFATAVRTGLGENQGLFFPKAIPNYSNIDELLGLPVLERNLKILKPFVDENLSENELQEIVKSTFAIPAKLVQINDNSHCLELFHGPTLAFKDFGATFMANCLKYFSDGKKITILTATSGDTGAAVAHAFHGIENIDVVILYPKGKISELQEKMFTTLGGNITTVAIEGTFDDCQALVKQSFDDRELVKQIGLNSANSINISRLLAQVCYYFDAVSQILADKRKDIVVSVPSGNFGNLTAGIIAKTLGLPIKRFIAATNINDTVPRYLLTGEWLPKETIATLSNAMDVSQPNNWPRIEYLVESNQFNRLDLKGESVNEEQTISCMLELKSCNYVSEPHAAVAFEGLNRNLTSDELGIFLGTAHPAKFKESVDKILKQDTELPPELASCATKESLSVTLKNDFKLLKELLTQG